MTAMASGLALGGIVGVLSGSSSAAFLVSLDWVTAIRLSHGWLVYLLPGAGFAVGLVYHLLGGRSGEGNALILDEIHQPTTWVPRRMAALVYGGTLVTHLFGGSAGREGTAIQMAGSLSDGTSRLLRLGPEDRRIVLVAALAGGFGSVFGVPWAGAVFALEVQPIRRLRHQTIVPVLVASVTGDRVVRVLGVHHMPITPLGRVELDASLIARVALAGLAFGLAARAFTAGTHWLKSAAASAVAWPPLRGAAGGVVLIALTLAVGDQTYNGLSLPLMAGALAGGAGITGYAFSLKALFTSVTLSTGFQGGEVTPLFVIGATLGVALAPALGVPGATLAAIGLVAVFAGAANVPLACTVMGAELFGVNHLVLFAIGATVSYAVSGPSHIYASPRRSGARSLSAAESGDDEVDDEAEG